MRTLFQEAAAQSANPVTAGVLVASVAALQGSTPAIDLASRVAGDSQRRTEVLEFAAQGLANVQLYREAAALLTASVGEVPSAATLARIRLLTDLKPYTATNLSHQDPRRPVQLLLEAGLSNTLSDADAAALVARTAYPRDDQWQGLLRELRRSVGIQQSMIQQSGLSAIALRDIVLGRASVVAEPGNGPGWRVTSQTHDKIMEIGVGTEGVIAPSCPRVPGEPGDRYWTAFCRV